MTTLAFPFKGEKRMKRLSTFVFALLLAGTLSFAQGTTGDKAADSSKKPATSDDSGKKGHKGGKKGHKGGKKNKKGAGDAGTGTPK
jgi:hypothetical protein